ncbi:MAG: hypothetical protein SFX72_12460 [Isosphaeraceae bacterium]|nr:hypothetical protein [Isosphaeraceae bacterium]
MFTRTLILGSIPFLACGLIVAAMAHSGAVVSSIEIEGRRIVVREAPELSLPPVPGSPVGYDCNSPLFWDDETLYAFTSHEHPFRSSGTDLENLRPIPTRVVFEDEDRVSAPGGRWIEAVHKATNGRLYMWYHNEPKGVVPGRPDATAPRIGQMVSDDEGLHWRDQGYILEADRSTFDLESANRYFVGGFGDFSVIADQASKHLYILTSVYHRDVAKQGVAIARIALEDLDYPAGRVSLWNGRNWSPPGDSDDYAPIFPAEQSWHRYNSRVLWGPSIHWNERIRSYVVVMNKASDAGFGQSGIYISLNFRLDDPTSWTTPVKLMDAAEWYPQVVGIDRASRGTDRLAADRARLFLKGKSRWTIEFR